MKDHNFIPDMTAAKAIYEKLCVKIIDQKCETEIPYYDYIILANPTNSIIECNVVSYREQLKACGVMFKPKDNLKFINIFGMDDPKKEIVTWQWSDMRRLGTKGSGGHELRERYFGHNPAVDLFGQRPPAVGNNSTGNRLE